MTHTPICPACNSTRFTHRFDVDGHPQLRCDQCSLEMLHPQPPDEVLASIYNEDYQLAAGSKEENTALDTMKEMTAGLYLDALKGLSLPDGAKLLEIGCGWGHFLGRADEAGFGVCGVELSPYAAEQATARVPKARIVNATIENSGLEPGSFDVCVMIDVIEHVRQPREFLETVSTMLKPGGHVLLVTPTTDSLSARLMGRHWMEYKAEHLFSFSRRSMRWLLTRTAFGDIRFRTARKALNFNFVHAYLQRFTVPVLTPLASGLRTVMPDGLAFKQMVIPAGGMISTARKTEK